MIDVGRSQSDVDINAVRAKAYANVEAIEERFTKLPRDAAGNSIPTPHIDARIIYVDKVAGDDGKGRIHTLGTLPNPGKPKSPGAISAYKTTAAANLQLRHNKGDWLLFKTQQEHSIVSTIFTRGGSSADYPNVYSSYGAGARPHLNPTGGALSVFAQVDRNYIVVQGLLGYPTRHDPSHADWEGWGFDMNPTRFYHYYSGSVQRGTLIEDCETKFTQGGCTFASSIEDTILRRNLFGESMAQTGEGGGIFGATSSLIIEENNFIRNGYYQKTIPWWGVASFGSKSSVTVSPDPGWGVDAFKTATVNIIDTTRSTPNNYSAKILADGRIVGNTSNTLYFEPNTIGHYPDADFTGGGQTFQVGKHQDYRLGTAVGKSQNIYLTYPRKTIVRENNFVQGSGFALKCTSNRYDEFDPIEPQSQDVAAYSNVVVDQLGFSLAGNTEIGAGYRYKNYTVCDNLFHALGRLDVIKNYLAWTLTLEDCDGGLVDNNLLISIGADAPGPYLIRGISVAGHARNVIVSRNVLFDVGEDNEHHVPGNHHPPLMLGGPNQNTDASRGNHIIANYIQQQNKSALVFGRYYRGAGFGFAKNKYFSKMPGTRWFDLDNQLVDAATFFAETGEADATLTPVKFHDPTRSIESYMASLGLEASIDAYAEALKTRRPELSSAAVYAYFKAGYSEILDDIPSIPVFDVPTFVNGFEDGEYQVNFGEGSKKLINIRTI